jgi:hypothetical protein
MIGVLALDAYELAPQPDHVRPSGIGSASPDPSRNSTLGTLAAATLAKASASVAGVMSTTVT